MKNNYRSLLAVVLSIGVLLLWYSVIAPPKPQIPPMSSTASTATQVTSVPQASEKNIQVTQSKEGQKAVLEDDLIRVTIDTMGGVVESWELKGFTKNGKESAKTVSIAEPQGGLGDLQLRDANFEVPNPIPFTIAKQDSNEVDLKWDYKGFTIWKHLRLVPNSYQLSMELEFNNQQNQTLSFAPTFSSMKLAVEESPQRGVLFFKTPQDKWHPVYYKDNSLKTDPAEKIALKTLNGNIQWAGSESRYFLGSLVSLEKLADTLEIGPASTFEGVPSFFTKISLPQVQMMPGERVLQKFTIYGGPKQMKYLEGVGSNLDKAIGYGWITWVATPIVWLLQFFYKLVHNYGIAIILLTIFVKILLNPINRKSLQSMKGMQALQPKLKEIRAKYGNDKERMNLETMQLFKSHKINPMGGCLPMLLQFPIYIALYQVLWNSVELYHAPFFWFYRDLSAPDPYLISPILLGITMFIQTKMTPSPSADPAQQKMMLFMPILFSGFMIFLPMGLVLYILVNTLMTILQQWMYQKGIRMRDILRGRLPAKA